MHKSFHFFFLLRREWPTLQIVMSKNKQNKLGGTELRKKKKKKTFFSVIFMLNIPSHGR
jgi:hypothetical protein